MKRVLLFPLITSAIFAGQPSFAQKTNHKASQSAAKAGIAAWSPDVQQYLGVDQASFRLVGLYRLSKVQLDALVNAAKQNITGDPHKYVLTCGPEAPAQTGTTRVLLTVSGDDPSGQRAQEIHQSVAAIPGVQVVDSPSAADRALHVVIQEQTLGKRTIGYTASYLTATPCTDQSRKAPVELKRQLGTYTDPRGSDLANDLARMLKQDIANPEAPSQ
jgi:hypothetical protein